MIFLLLEYFGTLLVEDILNVEFDGILSKLDRRQQLESIVLNLSLCFFGGQVSGKCEFLFSIFSVRPHFSSDDDIKFYIHQNLYFNFSFYGFFEKIDRLCITRVYISLVLGDFRSEGRDHGEVNFRLAAELSYSACM